MTKECGANNSWPIILMGAIVSLVSIFIQYALRKQLHSQIKPQYTQRFFNIAPFSMIRTFIQSPQSVRYLILWACVILLYSFYIGGHIPVSDVCYALRDKYSLSVYRATIILTGKILLAAFCAGTVYLLAKSQQKLLKSIVWGIFAAALFFSYDALVKISIEYIHFIQYCGLTLLLCNIFTKRLYIGILLALFLGLMDEVYQAYPTEPMNWRDTMLNVVGVIWGYLLYWTRHGAIDQ